MPLEKRSDTSMVIQPEGALGGDVVAKETIHGPADVLQTVTVNFFRPGMLDHLLHDEKHEDLHVRRILVARFARVGVPNENLVSAECHSENENDKCLCEVDLLK